MKFFENNFFYDYSFPAVSLAYFLRYPNPYSRHVLTTDVIDRYVDPKTGRLHTMRLHLKKSKVPKAMLKLLPSGVAGREGSGQSYILETSVVDIKEGWMTTESRNMEFTGILSVVEKQDFQRTYVNDSSSDSLDESKGRTMTEFVSTTPFESGEKGRECTNVKTTVIFNSRFGQSIRKKLSSASGNTFNSSSPEEEPQSRRFSISSWSVSGLQRTIELIGVQRTRNAVLRSKQGMGVVLERLKQGGIVGVLEGMKRDRELALLGDAPSGDMANAGPKAGMWQRVWSRGSAFNNEDDELS
ncbi:hypothetical protein KEM54_000269 [Ascosphaera aggregata]|nr:hypothetical protein KEM54_000269 [Ascosphaera aggregata]